MFRRLWSLLLVLIASSLVMTATVHARESLGKVTIECTGVVHSDGDADESQGDADKGMPHHHGSCHGSSIDVPASSALAVMTRASGMRPFAASDHETAAHRIDPALRPPAA